MTTLVMTKPRTAGQLMAKMRITGAKKGIFYALGGGMLWGLDAVILGAIMVWVATRGVVDETVYMLPLIFAMLHDAFGGVFMLIFCAANGKIKEYVRTLKTKPGWFICLAAVFGGPIAMSGYLLSIALGGTYAVAITACYPAVGAILAAIFLKEKIYPRVWAGIFMVLGGAIIISWVPPEGTYPHFYLGIGLALLATFGWAVEGVLGVFGMDIIDSDIALGIRELTSGVLYALFVLPLFGVMFFQVVGDAPVLAATIGVGFLGGFAYLAYYKGLNRAGVARGQALYVTYSIWYILFSWAAGQAAPTINLLVGAVAAAIGSVLIVGNPKELFSLRKI